jgi:hypothetical protein
MLRPFIADLTQPQGDFAVAFCNQQKVYDVMKFYNVSSRHAECLLVDKESVDAAIQFRKEHPHLMPVIFALKAVLNINLDQSIKIVETGKARSVLVEALQRAESCDTRNIVAEAICSLAENEDVRAALFSDLVSALQTANAKSSDAMRAYDAACISRFAMDDLLRPA